MSANNLVVLLTLPTLKPIKRVVKSYSNNRKREIKVCSNKHMCLVKKREYDKEMIQSYLATVK